MELSFQLFQNPKIKDCYEIDITRTLELLGINMLSYCFSTSY